VGGGDVTFQVERERAPSGLPEKETLEAFLDFHRGTVPIKVDGVGDEDLRRPMVPSGLSLLTLVKHLAYVERWWFRYNFAGEDVDLGPDPDSDFRIEPDETTEQILDFYRSECDASREITASASLDDVARNPKRPRTLRWILVHMIEEYARHNGHADLLRERIDGVSGT
jgi:uncharacterized damage-inducible protein DinB